MAIAAKSRINALARGLRVLERLNAYNGANANQVAQATGLSRGTAHRMLGMLVEEGFVEKRPDGGYWLTERVTSLSQGFRHDSWIPLKAQPGLAELTRRFSWPVSLLTPSGLRMISRAQTDDLTPMTMWRRPLGLSMSMLTSAGGRAYLAFLQPDDRSRLIDAALTAPDPRDRALAASPDFGSALAAARDQGFAVVIDRKLKVTNLAVPVLAGGVSHGALTLRFFTAAVRLDAALAEYLAPLSATAAAIGVEMETAAQGLG